MHSMSFHCKVSCTFPPSRTWRALLCTLTICNYGVEGNQNDRYPGMLFFQRRFIIRAKLNLPINYSSLSVRSMPSSRSRKREASRARLPFLFPENLDRSCSSPRKTRLHSRAPSCDFAHVYPETQWKTHVAGTHRRLLIRGVWFSFALQFNLPESHGIFASLFPILFFLSSSFLFDISNWRFYRCAIRQNDQNI